MKTMKAGAGMLMLVATLSAAGLGQVTMYKHGEMPSCDGTEKHLSGSSKIMGICVDAQQHFTGVYFGDEKEAYIKWLGINALREEGLTLTDRGELAKIDSNGKIEHVYGAKSGVPDDLRDAVNSNSASAPAVKIELNGEGDDEYSALENAFQSHENRTVAVPADTTDPDLLKPME